MATKTKKAKGKKPLTNARKSKAVGASGRPTAPAEARTISCKRCKARIEFTTGLDEMAKHWEEEHAEALAALRRGIDDGSRFPREQEG